MKINRIAAGIFNKVNLSSLTFLSTGTQLLPATPFPMDENLLQSRNIILSGEFFPTNEKVFKENLLKCNANVQLQMTPETEILICGKYPDWMLVEEARLYGVKIIFVDRAGELFSRITANLNKRKAVLPYEEPLGI